MIHINNLVKSKATIIFDPPFYKIVVESYFNDIYEVAKLTLGTSEPTTIFINNLINKNWSKFRFYRESTTDIEISHKKINPKRLQRISRKEISKGIGTKAQQSLKKQTALAKKESKKKKKQYTKAKKEKIFQIKQQKKYEKHKGH
ncbi:hypothetical protein AKUH3B209X_PPKS00210 (plasmid) [Apilactobacillus kunkeei]|nr:hypothetical protein AKUH4B403J_PPKS00210 [Apilactobacillus kunkeei]CAI2673503.1 hypothetical protein AKUH4B103J_PPKS00210 [Apilactobacillus kunkeei]CAI2674070.1 hypothetical protein AKUH4B203M_PPKS00210 [Apilactobacillus kunkeei]CAI2675597.1 hypothetical protein AKUH4B116J_PPKS00210 [Apilactobacillus kunkeei]CAI2678796.1 hypothetical protein AKUH4B104A_PPKS00210 [Apilactobacillus kunkeei]